MYLRCKDSQDEALILTCSGMVGERSSAPIVSHPVGSAVDSSCAQLEGWGIDVGINPHPGITKHLRHFLVCNNKLPRREDPSPTARNSSRPLEHLTLQVLRGPLHVKMHILGLCNGSIHGNSEILLKAALLAAVEHDPSLTVSWIHVPSVVIPRNAKPLRKEPAIIPDRSHEYQNNNKSGATPAGQGAEIDDRGAVFEAIMEADALIIATPIYSHQPAGSLKALQDAILGPFADTSEQHRKLQRQKAGDPRVQDVVVDPRAVKPRVAGFIAVAGSRGQFPEQWTLAMPSLHQFTYPLHCKVVDMVVLPGFAHAGSVLTGSGAVARASKIGTNVASQIGRAFDKAIYLGPEEDGSCPYCHLLKFEFQGADNRIRCITCGAAGELTAKADGRVRPIWDEDSDHSCITLKGKWQHVDDIAEGLAMEREKLPAVSSELERWRAVELPVVMLPSQQSGKSHPRKKAAL